MAPGHELIGTHDLSIMLSLVNPGAQEHFGTQFTNAHDPSVDSGPSHEASHLSVLPQSVKDSLAKHGLKPGAEKNL